VRCTWPSLLVLLSTVSWGAVGTTMQPSERLFHIPRLQSMPRFSGAFAVAPSDWSTRREELCNPVVVVPNFLSPEECDAFVSAGRYRQRQGLLSEDYLNHRVNQELRSGQVSAEAADLIGDQNLAPDQLAADCPSGTRTPLPSTLLLQPDLGHAHMHSEDAVRQLVQAYDSADEMQRERIQRPAEGSIARRVLDLLELGRDYVQFSEKLWYHPSNDSVMFR